MTVTVRNSYLTLSTAIIIAFTSCVSREQRENTINISGAFALYPLVIQWAEAYNEDNPEVRFNISAGGAGKGMSDAMAGTVDLGMFSREITREEKNRGVWWAGLCTDAVIPTVSARHPYLEQLLSEGLTQEQLRGIFIDGTITDWNQAIDIEGSLKINVYTRADACGAAGTWASYLGGKQEDFLGVGIFGDPALAEAVRKDPAGIGYNNTIFIYNLETGKKQPGLETAPIDLNGNRKIDKEEDFYHSFQEILTAIAQDRYPSPPARELYFISNGVPEKRAVRDFIAWVLIDGQKYVDEAGYVPLTEEKIQQYLDKLQARQP